MSEAVVHPILASTTVSEEARDLSQNLRNFYERNHTPIVIGGVLLVSLLMTRAVLRRELKRLRFAVEVISDGDLTDLSQFDYLDND